MRIKWIDYCKAIAIIAMIYDHVALVVPFRSAQLGEFIHLWHMPIFFFLSGVVLNEEKYLKWGNFKLFLKSRIMTLLIPYVLFGVIYMSLSFLCINILGFSGNKVPLESRLSGFIWNNNPGYEAGMYWFLTSLFFTELIFVLLVNILTKRIAVICSLLLILIVGFIKIEYFGVTLPLTLDTIPFTILVFSVGFFSKNIILNFHPNKTIKIASIFFLIISYLLAGSMFRMNIRTSTYSPYWILGLSIFIVLAIILLIKSVKSKKYSYISRMFILIGKNTLLLYCLNFMTIKIVVYFVPKTIFINPLISVLITLSLTLLVTSIILFIKYLFPRTINVLSGKF